MSTDLIARLRAQLDGPHDGALLRFSLGNALFMMGHYEEAVQALRAALNFDHDYSAAWKLLGKTLTKMGDPEGAIAVYREGVSVATARGDKQAEKEMRVFVRRLTSTLPNKE